MKLLFKLQLTVIGLALFYVFFVHNDGYLISLFTDALLAYVQEQIKAFFSGLVDDAMSNAF